MPTKSQKKSQAFIKARHRRNVRRLEKAGLLSLKASKDKAATRRAIIKYADLLSGKATAIKAGNAKVAQGLRGKLGLRGAGKTVVVPKHKGERVTITKENKITGTRQQYGQTVKREIGKRDFQRPLGPNERAYYTIPARRRGAGKLKRHTFASFDEMLFYLEKYEINFEEIEDYIEVEYFAKGGKKDKALRTTLNDERRAAVARLKRKRKRKPKPKTKPRKRKSRRKR